MRQVPIGAVLAASYFTIPPSYGASFPNTPEGWTAVVQAAQAKKAELVASLTESLGDWSTPDDIETTADVQVVIDLRWYLTYPEGGGVDLIAERFERIDRLRPSVLA